MTAPTRDDEPASFGTYTVEELADALREDPVIVQQIMGNGHTAEVDEALTALADEVDHPVFVALVNTPRGLAEESPGQDLASRLHAALGEDGLYVVSVDTEVGHLEWQGYGAGVPRRNDFFGVNPYPDHEDQDLPDQSAAGEAAELLATAANDLEALPSDELEAYRTSDLWARPGTGAAYDVDVPTDGTYAVVATGLGVGLAVLAWFVLRTVARWRELAPAPGPAAPAPGIPRVLSPQEKGRAARAAPPARPAPPTADGVRRVADRELTALARAQTKAARAGRAADPTVQHLVDGSRTTAETLLDTPGTDHDRALLDALGGLVLVRTARHALGHPGATTYRPCFFNPWHGEATTEVAAPAGSRGDQVELPACDRCRRGADSPELRDPLEVKVGRRRRPYWEDDTVWARTGFGAIADDLWSAVLDDRRSRR